ncbi:DUF4148 domain-containing protein [Bordetella bronchiseptica]|uniref:DUF4148 domain-containing protein n=1 Tax=Bordetella bronchiseptica TaxID=518 RepID=UPI0009B9275B|nr:DUF4148 domain-containing protein [Bordetella bronchiseptica]AWQ06865.1 hypothetical protein B9G73_19780 [Bordetella bronchiseptica]
MKAQTALIGFVILASSSLCWAGSVNHATGSQSLTREQVKAELEAARAQGLLNFSDAEYPVIRDTGPGKTRAEVLQELQEAREQGLLNFSDAEYPVIRNTGSVKARAEVLRELKKARQEGTYVVEP